MDKNKVLTGVVTYNRKAELMHLLKCLDKTCSVYDVLIIDNASNYDVSKTVANLSFEKIKVKIIRLDDNFGGAGGFKKIFEEFGMTRHKYLWVMDDDGFPEKNCLKKLLSAIKNFDVVGPLVESTENDGTLSFKLRINKNIIEKKGEIKKQYIENLLNPFNGTLIKRDVVKEVGCPDEKYFIWGDEVEWLLRLKKNKKKICVATDSVFYHPVNRLKITGTDKLWCLNNSSLKVYCFYRNQVNMRKRHCGKLKLLLWVARAALATVIYSDQKALTFKAMYDGLVENWGLHRDYL